MAKKFFTNESLATLIDEIKAYITNALSSKSDSDHAHDDVYYIKSEIDEMVFIDYSALAFDTTEIVIDTTGTEGDVSSHAIIGQAILGQMILS